jgi:hypothetical protein
MALYQSYLMRRMWLGIFLFACILSLVNCGKSDGGGGGGGTTAETPVNNTCGTGYLYANQQLGCMSVNSCNIDDTQVWWQNNCVRVADINNPQSNWYYMNYGNYGQNGGTYNGQYNGTYNPYNNYGVYSYGNPFYGNSGNPYNYGGYRPQPGFYGGGYIYLGY